MTASQCPHCGTVIKHSDSRAKPDVYAYPARHMQRHEAARYVGRSVNYLDTLVAQGLIASYTEGRERFFDRDDLDAYCRSRNYHPATRGEGVTFIRPERRRAS